jgi:hypothetical protein
MEIAQSHFGALISATLFALVFLGIEGLDRKLHARGVQLVSFSAGVAIAYVFLDVMPHLASKQRLLAAAMDGGLYGYLEHHAYLVSLIGFLSYLAAFLAVGDEAGNRSRLSRFSLSFGASAYVCLISYMVSEHSDYRRAPLMLFSLAMAIHMYGVAHYVRGRLGPDYRIHRFAIAGGAYAGWLIAVLSHVPETTYVLWFSFLSGGILGIAFNVELREVDTLPSLRGFVTGAALLTLLVLTVEYLAKVG